MPNYRNNAKQLVILSGKGGTGKTCLAASLIHLASVSQTMAVFVDADVDAANLALITNAKKISSNQFFGSQVAEIDQTLCNLCDACYRTCRFNAIHRPRKVHKVYTVDPLLCEGCSACMYACPTSAIQMRIQQDGEWHHSITSFGHLFHAELFPGAENSGKLVTLIKQNAKLFAEDHDLPLIIIDGPPGIGCPVISASAGADLALIVAEPGVSGHSDMERIIKTLNHFKIPVLICVNKADLYPEGTKNIEMFADLNHYPIVGKIPFDFSIPNSMVNLQPVSAAAPKSLAAESIRSIWENVRAYLLGEDN